MMLEQVVLLAAVTVLGLLEQAYFCLKVIQARRKHSVSPPATSGPPAFERIFRAQANSSEYFPIFVFSLWLAGVFFSQALAVLFGLLYLYGRYLYFHGYAESAQGRLEPLYFSAKMLWVLIALAGLGVICTLTQAYLGLDLLHSFSHVLGLTEHS
ncbi:leukotriene C4 synthase-like [Carassius auratus]|uniref:Leukotriene C4 synthase n=1 Tax=Carassius auratus TaxID=7957 RepID=A0A6P6QQ79_CARAU|nr:leukotriene C4 synthase-like [Carassius auratus]